MQVICQRNRTFKRKLGTRPDGKMRCCRRIAHQNDIFMRPAFAQNTREAQPRRTTYMMRIADQAVTIKMILKDILAGGDGFFFGHLAKAICVPGFLRTFDNESRRFIIKLIGMRPDPTLVGFFKDKGKSIIKFLMGAQPNKFAFARINIRLEMLLIFKSGFGI